MRRIIDGKVYDTETAEYLCDLTCRAMRGDFRWHSTKLYRSPKGQFFLAGEGGAKSEWAVPAYGGFQGGEGLRLIEPSEARRILELEDPDVVERLFNIEEG